MSLKLVNLIKNNTAMRYISFSTISLIGVMNNVSAAEVTDKNIKGKSDIEVVEVRGIRGSLNAALNNKRFSDTVMDSISAEDIGNFPDKNVGDALQRIPGVTVVRGFGEVSGVTIRGTAPQHSMVLLNEQNVASVGWFDLGGINRSFNFELLASEQVAGLDVYKSVESNINEGAIGGTVNLNTRNPLDLDAFTLFGSLEAGYSEAAEEVAPAYSGLFSWKDEDDKFGVLVAYSFEEQNVVRETLRSFGEPSNIKDTAGNDHNVAWGMSSILFDENRKRESTQLTLQYAATDDLLFAFDYNRFSLDNRHTNTALFAVPTHNGVLDANSATVNSSGATTHATVIPVSQDSDVIPVFNNSVLRTPKMETDVINLSTDYEGDTWSGHFVVGQSKAKSRALQTSTWWGNIADKSKTGFTFDLTGPHEMVMTHPDYVTDHEQMQLYREFTYVNNKRDHEINYVQADFELDFDYGMFSSLELGLKYQDQEFSASVDDTSLDINKAMQDNLTLADYNGGTASGLHSAKGRAGSLSSFALINDDIWKYGEANQGALNVTGAFSIEEEITAGYVKANFSGDNFRGNFGVRIVDTDVLSTGTVDGQPAQDSKNYSNILPSINVAADITDNILIRFAGGSTIARPDYDQMKMAISIQDQLGAATIGSPDIDPYKADQYDLSLEWYFDDSSLLSTTLFQKNISDYIETTTAEESLAGCSETCLVTRSRNVGTADISGIELQYQQDFGNGFGVQLNYTFTDSSVTNSAGAEVAVQGVSDNSYNVSGYFENDMFSARIAYNARDEWTSIGSNTTVVNEPYAQVDASIVWHALDNVDISFEGVNLFNEAIVSNLPQWNVIHSVDEFGARYYLSASVKF